MMPRSTPAALLLMVVVAGCAPSEGEPALHAVSNQGPAVAAADVRFMHGMIAHHAQALEVTGLVPTRTAREDVRLLARRIAISQTAEIGLIERWLSAHGQGRAGGDAHARMPGMLSEDELAELADSAGVVFDGRFLELMIRHHEGALVMVAELFANGGALAPEVFELASHMDADQRIEIDRMRAMQNRGPE
jgi:uncharacterized protein (DUF305 family)